MRRTTIGAALLLALPLASAQRPGIDAFFDSMAIRVAPGQQSMFVVGDNVAGYFEGYTQSHTRGGGYVLKNGAVFQGYASSVNDIRNERAGAREQVLPYGHKVDYSNGVSEEMALLSKKHAIALRLTSPRKARLAIEALLKSPGSVSRHGNVLIVTPADSSAPYMALAASQPVTLDGALTVRSARPTKVLNVIAAFGASAQEASMRATRLARTDAIAAERRDLHQALTLSYLTTSDLEYNKALNWAKASSRMFVVEEFGTGIWAGLPWFRDNWGRDTFIALPGTLLVSGQFEQAKAVLANFARYQNLKQPRDKEYGRIPNRIAAGPNAATNIIYNTVDGTPWMLREVIEYIRYTGDIAFAREMYRVALPYFEGAIANYVDPDGLLTHDSADTWMDARIENKQPWSARGPRAVEIQALWYTALQAGAYLAEQAGERAQAQAWRERADKARTRFMRLYWDGAVMADRLRDDGSRDLKVRPNQLMLVSIPFDDFVPAAVQGQVLRNTVSELLYPYGIASLSQNDPYFHPRHENPDFHHKDAAYHQGTIWGWNAGYTVTALNKFGYQDMAWALTKNLGQQILGLGTLGTMSELLDALPASDGTIKPSGTYAQSWSVAEYARNAYQDYVGFLPDMLANTLAFTPAIPAGWRHFDAVLPFGAGGEVAVKFGRAGNVQRWHFNLKDHTSRNIRFTFLEKDKSRSQVSFELKPGIRSTLELGESMARLNGRPIATTPAQKSQTGTIGELRFQSPKAYRAQDFPMLRSKDVLKGIVERDEYK